MKSKVRWYLGLSLGFVAGITFVISCGQGARSTAGEILQAIGISFDNSGTILKAQNLQALGTELNDRVVGLETKIGTLQDQIGAVQDPVLNLTERITDLEDRMSSLESSVDRAQEMIGLLTDAVTPEARGCLKIATTMLQTPADWVTLDQREKIGGIQTLDLACSIPMRYLKVNVTYSSDGGMANIRKIYVYGPDSPSVNLALNKSVSATAGSDDLESVVDGNLLPNYRRWTSHGVSEAVPHWIMVDLGQNYKVNKIAIDFGYFGSEPSEESYFLQGKRDE